MFIIQVFFQFSLQAYVESFTIEAILQPPQIHTPPYPKTYCRMIFKRKCSHLILFFLKQEVGTTVGEKGS